MQYRLSTVDGFNYERNRTRTGALSAAGRKREDSMTPKPAAFRHELENLWRAKVEEAQRRYSAATEEYRKLLDGTPEGLPPNPDSPMARARQAQSEALAEYSRVLRVFTGLTVHGIWPEEQSMPDLVAVIDDDKSVRNSVKTLLRSAGYRAETFESAEAFLESGAAAETGCLILDVRMPGMGGLALQVRLHDTNTQVPIVFITAHDEGRLREQVIEAGAVEMLHKPFAPNSLLSAVETALGQAGHAA
jgi:CheY-like chemotaxis protein